MAGEKKIMALRVSVNCEDSTLEFPANPYPMYPAAERVNYTSIDTAGGEQFVVNIGPTRVSASLSFKCVSYEFARKYENFLLNIIQLGLKPFTIICPEYIDFGRGKGMKIDNAYYNGPANLGSVIKPSGSNGIFYDLELPYFFVRDWE
jgi:hypothetical protein